jgi:hypothetical protein
MILSSSRNKGKKQTRLIAGEKQLEHHVIQTVGFVLNCETVKNMDKAIDDITPLFPMRKLSGAFHDKEVSSQHVTILLHRGVVRNLLYEVTLKASSVLLPLMEYLKLKADRGLQAAISN